MFKYHFGHLLFNLITIFMKNATFLKVGIAAIALGFSQLAIADNIYTIYPIPQQQVSVEGTAKVTSSVNVILEKGIDEATRNRIADVLKQHNLEFSFTEQTVANKTNIYLGINGSGELADQMATALQLSRDVFALENKYDRHCVSLTSNNGIADIVIIGENTDATFYGIASLEQMLDKDINALPGVAIYDYADQKSRGIVEGYYGYPYTVEVKKDLMRFMMRHKMNTYMYGAKSDPYHSQFWKNAYPTSLTDQQVKNGWLSQDMIKDVTKVSHDTKVNFIWAIHPGNDIINSGTVVKDVMSKFDKMYQLGVRQFAVFVDDVGVPTADNDLAANARNISNIQKEIEKKYNVEGAAPTDTVKPLHFVPQVYCASFAGNEAKRKKFFASLSTIPANITVYTTGWGVWSVPNYSDFELIKNELGRPGAWWWNYPCNDNADGQLYPMDMYSNFYDMPAVNDNATLPRELNNGLGIVCNPMQQGEVSKIPLFSAADFAWNTSSFNNISSWNASFPAIVGKEKAPALQLLAKYLRWNDPSELNNLINKYKSSLNGYSPSTDELQATMKEIGEACTTIESLKNSEKESDRLLYKDLAPWLLKLKSMANAVNQLVAVSVADSNDPNIWDNYLEAAKHITALDTAEMFKAYALEGMGNGISVSVRPSQPSQKYLYPFTKFLKEKAMEKYFPENETRHLKISNIEKIQGFANSNKNDVYVNANSVKLEKGDYIGLGLLKATKLAETSIADTLFNNFAILCSKNGKEWKRISNQAELLDDFVKYICVQNVQETPRTVRLSRRNFMVTLPSPTAISTVTIPSGNIWDNHTSNYLVDGDYNTFVCLHRCQQDGDNYTLKLNKLTKIYDVRICMGTVNGDHMNSGNVEISENGSTWKKIKIKNSYSYDFTMKTPQVVKYSEEMSYCDFDAKGEEALYVRFSVKSPRTDKWLRFYEMEVNKKGDLLMYKHDCEDKDGVVIEELCDKKAYTHMAGVNQSITCNFNDIHYLNEVQIYQDANASVGNPATIKVSSDGEVWKDYGKLVDNRQVIDLSQQADALQMKIEWTGEAPVIYEIISVANENKRAEVTKVEQLTFAVSAVDFTFNGKAIVVKSTVGIKSVNVYAMNGKTILNYNAGGATVAQIPQMNNGNQVSIVKVTLNNGETATYKLSRK